MTVILQSDEPVTLIGGAATRAEDLAAALAAAPTVVAADSGADAALAAGLEPTLVVGDMDSIRPETRARLGERVHEIAEQDSTDFDKVLRSVDAPLLIGVGFLGARLDHELAAMASLARSSRRCVLVGPHDVVFAAPRTVELDTAVGARVSLFPMARVAGRSEGLRWRIDGLDFGPERLIGTSNEATGRVRMWFDGPGMLVILPRNCLDVVVDALRRGGRPRSRGCL